MAKFRFLLFSVMVAGACLLPGGDVHATSWGGVPPQEVVDRADIIVTGRYDFSSRMATSKAGIFVGFAFEVERVYRGDVPPRIMAGIDFHDVALMREYQEQGGSFLLLLENRERYDYPVPVSGPNGMVPLKHGALDPSFYSTDERHLFFTRFLNEQKPLATYHWPGPGMPVLLWAGAAATGLLAFISHRFGGRRPVDSRDA